MTSTPKRGVVLFYDGHICPLFQALKQSFIPINFKRNLTTLHANHTS